MFLYHYIKVALRSIYKHKRYALLNIIGLSVGVTLSVVVLLFVKFELNYDTWFSNSEDIYRVTSKGKIGINQINGASTPLPLLQVMEAIPAVEKGTKIIPGSNKLVSYEQKKFNEDGFFFGDSSFFNVFDLNFISGNPSEALNGPGKVVLTVGTAKRYFGYQNPIGKIINREGIELEVTGVCEPMPDASHFHFDFMGSLSTIDVIFKRDTALLNDWKENWLALNCYTYVRLLPGAVPFDIEKSINQEKEKYLLPQINEILKEEDFLNQEILLDFFLQPLQDIHLYSDLDHELEPTSKPIYISIFIFVAGFILLLTCVNSVNLTTARSNRRFKEVAVRKILGAERRYLIIQFFVEAFVISLLAMFIGLVLVELLLPVFNQLFQIKLQVSQIKDIEDIGYVLVLTFLVSIFSGSYPAFFFSGLKPGQIFKGNFRMSRSGLVVRGLILTSQVMVMLFLLIVAAGMLWQVRYIQKADVGFDKEHLLVLERGYAVGKNLDAFKGELNDIEGVENVAVSMSLPGDEYYQVSFRYRGGESDRKVFLLPVNYVDGDYFETLGLKLKKGKFLSGNCKDSLGIVLNVQALEELGIKKPLGERLEIIGMKASDGWEVSLSGVVDDFHFESFNVPIKPLVIMLLGKKTHFNYILVRYAPQVNDGLSGEIERVWDKYSNGEPLESFELKDRISSLYEEEFRVLKIISVFAVLSIFLTFLGVISLVAFITEYNGRQYSIKKIIGAAKQDIMMDVLRVFGGYLILGILLAIPLSYLALQGWLSSFAYYKDLPVWGIGVLAILVGGVSFVAVLVQSYRAVSDNPVLRLQDY
ncbi:ABC transporter permease [Marinilabiliaceae bacterium JC017]|nr:ABC transporter permease [Marinilabiliaceae bacterium JC017]